MRLFSPLVYLSGLRGVGVGGHYEAVGADAIEDGIRSAASLREPPLTRRDKDEFTDSWFGTDAAEIGMNAQSFDDGDDADG